MSEQIKQTIKEKVDQYLNADHFSEKVRSEILSWGEEAMKIISDYASGSYPDDNRHFQSRAILLMGESEDHQCVPVLEKVLRDPDEDIRSQAIMALGFNNSEQAADVLSKVLESQKCSSIEVGHCIESLQKLSNPKAQDALQKLAQQADLESYLKADIEKALQSYK
ncbi:MAG: HEAT repeat domain-containing protein [Cyanothece sp. SIO1E1]|nr:HEAT repeat domain-containing protein [Cyanothece sp. SIO1E1]